MASENLSVVYDGPVVEAGRMEVRELAPSVLAFADLIQEVQFLLYPDDPRVTVEVVAARESSFAVDLSVVHGIFEQARSMFAGETATAAVNLTALCGVLLGAIKAVKAIAGRVIERREDAADGSVRLILEDGTVYETTPAVVEVFERSTIRRLMRDFMRPLRRDGMSKIRVEHGDDDATVTRADRESFEVDPDDEIVTDSTTELLMRIASLQFNPGNKWKLTDGTNSYWVRLQDPHFVNLIERDEARFARHDLLHVRLRTIQYRESDGKLRTEHHAERIRHIPAEAAEQGNLEL